MQLIRISRVALVLYLSGFGFAQSPVRDQPVVSPPAIGGGSFSGATVMEAEPRGNEPEPHKAKLGLLEYSTDFAWTQLPATDLSTAGAKTVSLVACPMGVIGSEMFYDVYISGT